MKKYGFPIILCILAFVITLIFFDQLPDKVPKHWNISGDIDAYGDKYSIFMIPLMMAGMNAMFIALPRIDPRRHNYQKFQKSYVSFMNVITAFMFLMLMMTIYASFNPNQIDISMVMTIATGILISYFGNIMPKFRWNYFVGIRCPWTLSNEQVWFLTHRFGGKLWMVAGFLIMLGAFLPSETSFYYLMTIVLTIAFVPMIYAYIKFKQLQGERK